MANAAADSVVFLSGLRAGALRGDSATGAARRARVARVVVVEVSRAVVASALLGALRAVCLAGALRERVAGLAGSSEAMAAARCWGAGSSITLATSAVSAAGAAAVLRPRAVLLGAFGSLSTVDSGSGSGSGCVSGSDFAVRLVDLAAAGFGAAALVLAFVAGFFAFASVAVALLVLLALLVLVAFGGGSAASSTAFLLPARLGGALSVVAATSGAFFAPERVATMVRVRLRC